MRSEVFATKIEGNTENIVMFLKRGNKMKKILQRIGLLSILMILFFSLLGCGASNKPEPAAVNLLDSGNEYMKRDRYEEAIGKFTKALENSPKYSQAFNRRGDAYTNLERYNEAIADYTRAIEINPKYALAFSNRGYAYYMQKKYNEAIADYTQAIKIYPKYEIAFVYRGEAYYALKKYDEVIANATRFVENDSQNAVALNFRGYAYYVQKKYNEAIADYTQAIKLNPKDEQAFNYRGDAYYVQKKYAEAIADYTQAIKINPKYAQAFENRGHAHLKQGHYSDAASDFTKGMEIDQKFDVMMLYFRGTCYAHLGRIQAAVQDLQQFVAQSKNNDSYREYRKDASQYIAANTAAPSRETQRNTSSSNRAKSTDNRDSFQQWLDGDVHVKVDLMDLLLGDQTED